MCTLCQCTYCSRQEEGIRIVQLVLVDYHDDRVNNIKKSKDRLQASSMDENHGNQELLNNLEKQKSQYIWNYHSYRGQSNQGPIVYLWTPILHLNPQFPICVFVLTLNYLHVQLVNLSWPVGATNLYDAIC